MSKEIILSKEEFQIRLKLFESHKARVIPKEENRLYSYILRTGELPKINKTGRIMYDIKKIIGSECEK